MGCIYATSKKIVKKVIKKVKNCFRCVYYYWNDLIIWKCNYISYFQIFIFYKY